MPRPRWLLALGALITLHAAPALGRPSLPPAEWSRVAHYDVLTYSDPWQNGLDRAKAIGIVDFPPEQVFRIVTDYARWKEYLPRVKDSRVLAQTAKGVLIDLTADLPWPAGISRVVARYVHERLPGDIYRIRFEMVGGTMKQYLGSLYIEPLPNGRSALTYELVAEPDVLAPDSTINKSVLKSAAGFVHALRWHINKLYQSGLLKNAPAVVPQPGLSSAHR